MLRNLRVRFAPSPTGRLHLGGARTALFNYLFAKSGGGSIILRIEDTDRERLVLGAAKSLQDSLDWLGLRFDEGPISGGAYGPYVQSERFPLYQHYAKDLVATGHAYHCFCSKERLNELAWGYDRHCRNISHRQVQEKLQLGEPCVIRFKVPDTGTTVISDEVFGKVEVENSTISDHIILKTDGTPTYHLAAVVDDHLMEISHVLRGEEWLLSTAKHLLLYSSLRWSPPTFAHLPLLMSSPGKKLSKRHGDTFVDHYKDRGFQSESIVNFLAYLGWGPTTTQSEGQSMKESHIKHLYELCEEFSLQNVCKDPVIISEGHLKWLNKGHFRKKLEDADCLDKMACELQKEVCQVFQITDKQELYATDRMKRILVTLEDRIPFIVDIPKEASYFWTPPIIDNSSFSAWGEDYCATCLQAVNGCLDSCGVDDKDTVHMALKNLASSLGVSSKKVMAPTRMALTGVKDGPSLYAVMKILGIAEVHSRLTTAVKNLEQTSAVLSS